MPLLRDVQQLKPFQLQGGFAPLTSHQGLCPWTPLGALPPDPRYRLALRAGHGLKPPPINSKSWLRPCLMLPIICMALVLRLGHATEGARVGHVEACCSGLLRHGLNFSTATEQCRKRLEACINAEGGHSIQYTCCDIACLTFQLPHITTGSFQSH